MSTLDTTFEALADGTRRSVIGLLRAGPRRAGDLADALGVTPPAMSRHLRVLRQSGLVDLQLDEDDARAKIYLLRQPPFTELRGWLDDVERFWSAQLTAFSAHAEKRRKK